MTLGQTHRLKAIRQTDHGLYFSDGQTEVLLPRSECPPDWAPGTEAPLFVYRDSEDRRTATRLTPAAEVGQIVPLEVTDQSPAGAFLDWGLRKDLLLPRSEQPYAVKKGQKVWIVVLIDPTTDRLYASARVENAFNRDLSGFRLGDEVDVQVWRLHPLGWSAVVERRWQGLVYGDEAGRELKPGERVTAWISALRPDGKMDLRLRPQGFSAANPDAERRVLLALETAGGRLGLSDQSSPQEIQAILGLSKKAFKAACGTLAKKGRLAWTSDGITSTKSGETSN